MGRNTAGQKQDLSISCLEGKVAPEILKAPKTGGDPKGNGHWPGIHSRSLAYLLHNVVDKPWGDQLVLAAAVLSAQRYDPATVKNCLCNVNARLTALFRILQIESLDEWDAEKCMVAYLKGELLSEHSQSMRAFFYSFYLTCVKQVGAWFSSLPAAEQTFYRSYLLPEVHPAAVHGLTRRHQVEQQARQVRKEETDAITIQFSDLRAEAHYRYNRMVRLRQAYLEAVGVIRSCQAQGKKLTFPFAFSYDEGGDPERGLLLQSVCTFESGAGATSFWPTRRVIQDLPFTTTKTGTMSRILARSG